MKKKHFILIGLGALVLAGILFGGKMFRESKDYPVLSSEEASKIQITPESYDIGVVKMKDGIITRGYEIKNDTGKTLVLRKIVTSCMCTRAQVEANGKRTSLYAMEMGGDNNPRITFEIPASSTAKLVVKFDPAAHGPAGVGKIDRTVWLTFADPVGVKEVRFWGEVVLQ